MSVDDQAFERDLRAALEPERPEPEAFHAEVERKLARLRAEGEAPAELSRAASFLPPAVLAVGSLTGKHTLGKLLSVLSLPATVVGLFVYFLVSGVTASRSLDASRDDREKPSDQVLRWWQFHRFAIVPVVGLFLFLGWRGDVDLLLFVLLLSMGSMLFTLRRLSDKGMASRRIIAQQTGGFLSTIGVWLWLLGGRSPELQSNPLQLCLIYALSMAVGFLCMGLGLKDQVKADRRKTPPAWVFAPFGLVLGGLLLLMFLFIAPARSGASVRELTAWIEQQAPATDETVEWRRLNDAVRILRRVGVEPALDRARAALDPLPIDASFVLGDAASLGLLTQADCERLVESKEVSIRLLRNPEGRITSLPQNRALLHSLAVTETLDALERENLARRLVASWDEADEYAKLETLREIIRGLDDLGREDLVDALSPKIERALIEAWLARGGRPEHNGGFVGYFRKGKDYADLEATGVAVELMARFGVPGSIDLDLVHGYLRREASRYGYITALDEFDVRPAATLLHFEHEFGALTSPSPLQRLWSWRHVAAVAALCGLCIFATLSAPRRRTPTTGPAA